jgi:uncharacterized damage-inducible protein DinB
MNLQDAQKLIAFHYWARNRMLDALDPLTTEQLTREIGGSFGSIRNTVAHTLWAERAWLARWKHEAPINPLAADKFPDLASIRNAWNEQETELRRFFDAITETELRAEIAYKTLAGVDSRSILWQMLQHVVNHATYHRGQVTTLLRQLGMAPPKATDLILFYRENP